MSYLGVIGGVCSLAGYVPYARTILKGKSVPKRASWLVWTLSNILIVMSYWALGARSTIWVPIAYFLGSLAITLLSFKYGRQAWGKFEGLAFVVVMISSIRWFRFDTPLIALALNMTIGFIGYIPVIARLYKDPMTPEELDLEGWTLFFLGSAFNLAAISSWTFVIALLPVSLFIMNGATFALALRNSAKRERKADKETDGNPIA
ncbi:MAG TPA: hypothetical protein VHD69_00560 [Candidatus Paceibacterota bacterium]|nr:hypothetical protein [Candidatus Paceibacterota bacterium]